MGIHHVGLYCRRPESITLFCLAKIYRKTAIAFKILKRSVSGINTRHFMMQLGIHSSIQHPPFKPKLLPTKTSHKFQHFRDRKVIKHYQGFPTDSGTSPSGR